MSVTLPAVGDKGTASFADIVAGILNGLFQGESSNTSTVTLSTTSDFAGLATDTFTLATTKRVLIGVQSRYQIVSASGRMLVQAGYNTGASAVIGSVVKVGTSASVVPTVVGLAGSYSGWAWGTALLAAGQYTAYPVVTRFSGGSATDVASGFQALVFGLADV